MLADHIRRTFLAKTGKFFTLFWQH